MSSGVFGPGTIGGSFGSTSSPGSSKSGGSLGGVGNPSGNGGGSGGSRSVSGSRIAGSSNCDTRHRLRRIFRSCAIRRFAAGEPFLRRPFGAARRRVFLVADLRAGARLRVTVFFRVVRRFLRVGFALSATAAIAGPPAITADIVTGNLFSFAIVNSPAADQITCAAKRGTPVKNRDDRRRANERA